MAEGRPDPDRPGESGASIAADMGSGPLDRADGAGRRIVMPLAASASTCEIAPERPIRRGLADGRNPAGLTCVVFDTETTGLGPGDRIVQTAGLGGSWPAA